MPLVYWDRNPFTYHPREGGYTFVTAPDWPGFSFMKEPGEDDADLWRVFKVFRQYERRARWRYFFRRLLRHA